MKLEHHETQLEKANSRVKEVEAQLQKTYASIKNQSKEINKLLRDREKYEEEVVK